MYIFPAIDIIDGKAVRLFKGDYSKMTVYDDDPLNVVRKFQASGASCLHLVDLDGAKCGGTPNFDTVRRIADECDMFVELGGGIRSFDVIEKYLSAGIDRVILGTAAVKDEGFAREAIRRYGNSIAVGIDIKDGYVAVKGWTEKTEYTCREFFAKMQDAGVETVICTDISKDGAMKGTNRLLYQQLSEEFSVNITASGGVSSMDDIVALHDMDLYGAIIGKAYYTGAIDLSEAIKVAAG